MRRHHHSPSNGFTLIELLVVIGILAILAAAVIIAVNPARQFAQARNAQRRTDVLAVLNAVHQNAVDNRGNFTCAAGAIPTTATTMRDTSGYNICSCIVTQYLSLLPKDPSAGTGVQDCSGAYNSGYNIQRDATSGRVTISAPSAELSETISATR